MKKTILAQAIEGSKGGGNRKAVEAPDSLFSIANARIVDLVSEGEIEGFAHGGEGMLKDVYYDETPVENPDGSRNFKFVTVDARYGTQDQEYIPGFPAVENELGIGIELKFGTAWSRSFTNRSLSAVRVRLGAGPLSHTNDENGDVSGTSVSYAIDISTDGGPFTNVLTSAFTGKASSMYERGHRIDLPKSTASGWVIRVRRLTPDSSTQYLQNGTYVLGVTEIVDGKFRYPMSALVATEIDASQFQTIPRRAFHLLGRIIRVPSNYDPVTRTYAFNGPGTSGGAWDGTFKPAYSNNPAWVFYDIITHKRYGLGGLLDEHRIDKWSLYAIAQWCDQIVPDGFGGEEPRMTCNLYLQSAADAWKVLGDLTSVFRAICYWAGGAVVPVADRPSDPVYTYTNSNVVEGLFRYASSSRQDRHSAVLVSYNDMTDMARLKTDYYDDPETMARFGFKSVNISAIGCTSRGQARRLARWVLLSEKLLTNTVTFTVGADGTFAVPGQIVRVADQYRAGRRIGGRIAAATRSVTTPDAMPSPAPSAGDSLTVVMPDGITESRVISSVTSDTITVSGMYSDVPVVEGAWTVDMSDLSTQLFRVLAVSKDEDNYVIQCLQHNPTIYGAVDHDAPIVEPPISVIPNNNQKPPTEVVITSAERAGHVITSSQLTAEWPITAGAVRYRIQWQKDDGPWTAAVEVHSTTADYENAFPGIYRAKVEAVNALGIISVPTVSPPFTLTDQTKLPGVIEDHEDRIEQTQQQMVDAQAAIDQEVADRIAGDLQTATEAAADAQAKANAALAQAQAAVDALAAEIGEITGAPVWEAGVTYQPGWLVKFDGGLYRARVQTTGHQPDTSPTQWEKIGDYESVGEALAAALTLATQTASELEAQVARIDAMVARIPTGDDDLATEAMVLAEAQARVTAISAEADRIDALLARMPTVPGRVATEASVSAEAQARADGDNALAAQQNALSVALGQVVTVDNPSFEREGGWTDVSNNPLPSHVYRTSSNAYQGSYELRIDPGASVIIKNTRDTPVAPAQRVRVQMRTRSPSATPSGTEIRVGLRIHSTTGSVLGNYYVGTRVSTGTTWTYANGIVGGELDMPAGAAYAYAIIYCSGMSSGSICCDMAEFAPFDAAADATASALAATNVTVNQQGADLSAQGAQLASLAGQVAGKADFSYVQAIEGTANTAGANASSALSQVTGLSATVGSHASNISQLFEVQASSNEVQVLNPGFESDSGWSGGTSPGPLPSLVYYTTTRPRSGARALRFDVNGTVFNLGRTPTKTGEQFLLRACVRASPTTPNSGARFSIGVRWYNASGGYMSGRNQGATTTTNGSNFAYGTFDPSMVVAAPEGAVSVQVYLDVANMSSGSVIFDDIALERLSETEASARSAHTVALNVNGHISGTVSENDGTTSRFSILATIFELIASGTVGMEVRHPRANTYYMRFYAAGAQAIIGINFGAAQNLVGWFGPNIGEAACRTNNGTIHATNTGDAYFGGRLTSGTLTTAGSFNFTGLSTGSKGTLVHFGSTGRPKMVSISFNYGELSHIRDFPTVQEANAFVNSRPSRTGTFTIQVRRNGASVGSWTFSGTSFVSAPIYVDTIPPKWQVNVGHHVETAQTFTDNFTGSGDVEYTLHVTSNSGSFYGNRGTFGIRVVEE